MEVLVQYLISICAVAIICGIVKVISDEKKPSGAMIRMIAGLIMAFTVVGPVVDLEPGDLPVLKLDIAEEAQAVSEYGKEFADAEVNSIITRRLEAYILDKAASIDADISVELRLVDYRPVGVTMRGPILPRDKQRLQQILETDLGISKENQKWIQ